MSVANLLVPNNLDLYCNNINISGSESFLNGFVQSLYGAVTTTSTSAVIIYSFPIVNNNSGYSITIEAYCYSYPPATLNGGGSYTLINFIVSFVGGVGTVFSSSSTGTTASEGAGYLQNIAAYPNPPTQTLNPLVTLSGTTVNISVQNGYASESPTDWLYTIKIMGPIIP